MGPKMIADVEVLQLKVRNVEEVLNGGNRKAGLIERVEVLEKDTFRSKVVSAVISAVASGIGALVVFLVTVMPALAELRKLVTK